MGRNLVEARMIGKLHDWAIELAQSHHTLWTLAPVAFVESFIFPILPVGLILAMEETLC